MCIRRRCTLDKLSTKHLSSFLKRCFTKLGTHDYCINSIIMLVVRQIYGATGTQMSVTVDRCIRTMYTSTLNYSTMQNL